MPFVARWPRVIPAGRTSVTFAANLSHPSTYATRNEGLVLHSQNGSFAIRKDRWKLILSHGAGADDDPALDRTSGLVSPVQLFDLDRDPKETANVAEKHPDVVRTLERLLQSYRNGPRSRRR